MYLFAILSLAKIPKAKTDPEWIAKRLGITQVEALSALRRLIRPDIIEDNKWLKQKSESLNIVSPVPSAAIQKYHSQILEMTENRMPLIQPAEIVIKF